MIAVMYGAQGNSSAAHTAPVWLASWSTDGVLVPFASKVTVHPAVFASEASDGRGATAPSNSVERAAIDASRSVSP